jgi:hypothetical protein
MGKYIGTTSPYGIYEKQTFDITSSQTKFTLSYRVGYSTSVLVIWDFEGASKVLIAEEDYSLVDGGTAIQLSFDPFVSNSYTERLYIIYLGREVAVPATRSPLLIQKTGETSNTILVTNDVILDASGLLVLKNGTQLRYGTDFTLDASAHSVVLTANANASDTFDFYVLSGINLQSTDIVDSSVTQEKIANRNVSAEKLNLSFARYDNLPSGNFYVTNTVGRMTAQNITNKEAVYMLQGEKSEPTGVPVKVRVKFTATLTGVSDNKVRFSLPPNIKNISTIIGGTVVISNGSTVETGILRWAGEGEIDIYRPSGVNYELTTHTFEAAFEYLGRDSSV